MDTRWTGYWVGLGVLSSTCVIALGHWYRRALLKEGMRLVAEEHYLPAVRVLRRAVALTSGEARAHYYLGLAYAGIGEFGASLGHLEEAMRLAAVDARFHGALAQYLPRPGASISEPVTKR